jgi:DNA polymerase-3 subunit alpha
MRIEILPVNINNSKSEFSIEGKSLRMAMTAIKGVGMKAAQEIENLSPFKSFDRFVEKTLKITVVNKSTIELLIHEGAFCDFDIYGQDGVEEYHKIKKNVEYMKSRKVQRSDMFADFDDVSFK